jgi:hypothetical protein
MKETQRRLPSWLANEVTDILRGEPFARDEPRFEPNRDEPGVTDVLNTARFSCGCVASDDAGWQSCGVGLHAMLSGTSARSARADEFRQARAGFDAVLAEAWRQRGGGPDNSVAFHAARQREFISFERWSSDHDLAGQPVWKHGHLHAELRAIPHDEDIKILPSCDGSALSLEWTSERGAKQLPFSAEEAVRIIFGGPAKPRLR